MTFTATPVVTSQTPTQFNGGANFAPGLYYALYNAGAFSYESGMAGFWGDGCCVTDQTGAPLGITTIGATGPISITTASPHSFATGQIVLITGIGVVLNSGSPTLSGLYQVTVTGASTFTLNGTISGSYANNSAAVMGGNDVLLNFGLAGGLFATEAAAEAAGAGTAIPFVTISSNPIGVVIVDSFYSDNTEGVTSYSVGLFGPCSFSATPLTCSGMTTLSWSFPAAVTVSINQGIGTVASTGTMTVYAGPGGPTYTLTAASTSGGVVTNTLLTATPSRSSQSAMLLFPVPNSTPQYFNAGANYAAGVYLVTCCGGAFSWNGIAVGVNANDRKFNTSQAFKVFGTQGTQIDAPGSYPNYGNITASDAANLGATQIFNHAGGPIGIFLNLDNYAAAIALSEAPGFSIAGPAPTVSLTANTLPVIAGTSVPLTWAVNGSTDPSGISISPTIGVVAQAGTTNVSPTSTTRYTLTATYQGLTVTTYADVLIGTPSIPVAAALGACNGTVGLAWSAPTFTTQTLVERSAVGGGVGFTQIAAVAVGTLLYVDTPPVAGQVYYYRLRGTDGTNYSGYTLELAVGSLVTPPAVTNLAVTAPSGTPVLTWTAIAGATSYLIQRGTTPGGETTVYQITGNAFAGVTFTIPDPLAVNGVLTYYVVRGVNGCGPGPASNEVSVTPGTSTSPYVSSIV